MASAQQWPLRTGTARVFTASDEGILKPLILASDEQAGPTDFTAFEAGVDHSSYSFLAESRARDFDLILVGYNDKAQLSNHADAVMDAIFKAISERIGNAKLVVGGIGRGALAARYTLAGLEVQKMDHQTEAYFSYNGTAPSQDEAGELLRLGNWPRIPMKFKVASGDFTDELIDRDFDDTETGASNTGGPLITKELGTWLLDRSSRIG